MVCLVEFDHLIFASASLNCSGSFMSLISLAMRVNLCMLFCMVTSFLPIFRSSPA